jgi:hypothetical protein
VAKYYPHHQANAKVNPEPESFLNQLNPKSQASNSEHHAKARQKSNIPMILIIPIFPVLIKISFSIRLSCFKIIRFRILNFGYCNFFVIWDLLFEISINSTML